MIYDTGCMVYLTYRFLQLTQIKRC